MPPPSSPSLFAPAAKRLAAVLMAACWCGVGLPAYAVSTGDPLAWQLSALEGARFERLMCALWAPELKEQNEAAFAASPYAKWTGEELIKAMTSGAEQAQQLAALPALRAQHQKSLAEMPAEARRRICAGSAAYLEDLTLKGVKLGPKP